jgi:outer membrane protein assembly factor BamA
VFFVQKSYWWLALFQLTFFLTKGQNYELQIANSSEIPLKHVSLQKKYREKNEAFKALGNLLSTLRQKGYLLADIDTISVSQQQLQVRINSGAKFKWTYLKPGNLNPTLASKLGYSEKLYTNKPFYYKQTADFIEKILLYYENNGYPFAHVKLDSVVIDGSTVKAVLNVNREQFFKLDSVLVIGSARLNSKFLYRYLSVFPGKPYNEKAIGETYRKLNQLPYISQAQAQQVRLTEGANKLLLFLNKKNASQFDGIFGIQPDATNGKTVLTGDVKIKLVNGLIQNGETFDLEWRRLQQQTQDFKGKLIYPYMFGTSFGSDYGLKIYKRDTTFIDINNDFGLHYYFSALNYIKLIYKQRNSNLISTAGLENITILPSYADISSQLNGFGFFFENLDYRFNPRKGLSVQINATAGRKTIRKNPRINEIAYKDLQLNTTLYNYDAVINAYTHIGKNNVFRFGLQSASIFGNGPIFTNELLRIGGLRSLRGFDEESIFTSFYVIPTLEYRFLFGPNSNIIIFTEGAFYEANTYRNYLYDKPVSFGTGINFETKAGILSINYAIGNQFNQGFDARNGKIHFGLTALF